MFLPIGDEPNPRGIAWVNWALILANISVFAFISLPLMEQRPDLNDPATLDLLRLLSERYPEARSVFLRQLLERMTAYDVFLIQWGYRPGEPSLVTLMTSMFLHGGWLHLFGNMLFLWIYGDNVEEALGRLGYLGAYLGTGVAAAVGYGAVAPESVGHVPMVGASGAISGVLGCYFVWFPRNRVKVLVFLFPFYMNVVLVRARLVLGFYLLVENLLPFLLLDPEKDSGVAHGAHIGGFVAGLLLAFALTPRARAVGSGRGPVGAERPPVANRAATGAGEVGALFYAGDIEGALGLYSRLTPGERQQVPFAAVADLAAALANRGRYEVALGVFKRAIGDHPRDPDVARAFLGIGLILLYGRDRPASAQSFLLDALDATPRPEVAEAARAALGEIERRRQGKSSLRH